MSFIFQKTYEPAIYIFSVFKARAGFAVKLSKRSICNKQGVFDSLE